MWTQIFQIVTAMSQGRHLLEFLPLCIAFMLRGVGLIGWMLELYSVIVFANVKWRSLGLGDCWPWTPKSYLLVCFLVPLLGVWSWMKRLMDLVMAWCSSCL